MIYINQKYTGLEIVSFLSFFFVAAESGIL